MATAENMLDRLLGLSEEERTELALALLDSVDAFDPHADLSADEFRAELDKRTAEALADPGGGTDWADLRARLERDTDD